jgi:GDSL-like Lipase/Acylhydrolase family
VIRSRAPRPLLLASALALSLVLAACSHAHDRAGAPGSKGAATRIDVLVAVGSGATFGAGLDHPLTDSWPQRLYHEAFPRSAVFVNAGNEFLTVHSALVDAVPLAIEVHATVVAVWLGDADHEMGVPVATFEADLSRLVARLRAAHARVLLGNLPVNGHAWVAEYNAAIARVARSGRATLVDIAAAVGATPGIGPTADITPKASATIAGAFAAALARS